MVPVAIIVSVLALVAYAARESLRSAIPVTVAPVVLKVGGAPAGPTDVGEIVQAPGWIEADPYAVGAPALAAGVVRELLVLEGQRVEAGQVVARLVDEDARLAHRRAAADLDRARASAAQARATLAAERARADEAHDALHRRDAAAARGASSEQETVAARLQAAALDAVVGTAEAAVSHAEAEAHMGEISLEEAALALDRMEVRAPIAGVVLLRLVEPGQRLMPDANNPFAGVVVRLYDPGHLQVRIDIPLSDAAKVREGDVVEVTTETLPDRVFHAIVTRFVHEANLQKNTVQVKAAIADPAPELKPEMLARARITTRGSAVRGGAAPDAAGASGAMLAPRAAVLEVNGSDGAAWVVDQVTSTAGKRRLKLGHLTAEGAEVLDGLRPGDRVILSPPADLREGARVRASESKEDR
jgi:RND family efflux transporter MFP subunit